MRLTQLCLNFLFSKKIRGYQFQRIPIIKINGKFKMKSCHLRRLHKQTGYSLWKMTKNSHIPSNSLSIHPTPDTDKAQAFADVLQPVEANFLETPLQMHQNKWIRGTMCYGLNLKLVKNLVSYHSIFTCHNRMRSF